MSFFSWTSISQGAIEEPTRRRSDNISKLSTTLFSPISPLSLPEQKRYSNKNYSTEEERLKFFEKIKDKQKTELCKNFSLYHYCPHKDNCSFAHGQHESRQTNISFIGYKTKICKMFTNEKFCIFGSRCNYIHRVKEKRYFSYFYILNKTFNNLYKELIKYENLNKDPWIVYKLILSKRQIIM